MSTPSGPPTPLSWWGHAWRLTVVALGMVAIWASGTIGPESPLWVQRVDVAGGVVALVLVAFRRRLPLPVALAVSALGCVSATAGAAWFLAVTSLATRRRWAEVLPVGVVSLLSTLLTTWRERDGVYGAWVPFIFEATLFVICTAIGFYLGARTELVRALELRAETAEREQAMRVTQARLTERARIAREMHDVIAHRMSLVAMHAGALTYREDLTAAQRQETAELIRQSAHQALTELRGVLGVLRDPAPLPVDLLAEPEPGPDGRATGALDGATGGSPSLDVLTSGAATPGIPHPEPPQPTFAGVASLLAEARAAGMEIEVRGDWPEPDVVPQRVGRTTYRIVQEALTNARKHAPGQPVLLALRGRPGGRLHLEVSNPLPGESAREPARETTRGPWPAPGRTPGAGLGLTGLVERASLAGGSATYAARAGRFTLSVDLPWKDPS